MQRRNHMSTWSRNTAVSPGSNLVLDLLRQNVKLSCSRFIQVHSGNHGSCILWTKEETIIQWYYYSRCLFENSVNKFKEPIVPHLPTVEYGRTIEGDDLKCTPANIAYFVNNTAHILHSVLVDVAPLKKRVSNNRSSAPWNNSHICTPKQKNV